MTSGLQPDGSYGFDAGRGQRFAWLSLYNAINDEGFKINLLDGTYYEDDFLFEYRDPHDATNGVHLYPMNDAARLWLLLNLPTFPEGEPDA